MTQGLDKLLAERSETHGDWASQAVLCQRIKSLYRSVPGWNKLTDEMREALDMSAMKDSRILTGDPWWQDHWQDKAGYSLLGGRQPVRQHEFPF